MLERAWALLPTVAVIAAVVMGLIDVAKDLFLRRMFYAVTVKEISALDTERPGLFRLRVSQFVGQLGALAQRAIERVDPTPTPKPFEDRVLEILTGEPRFSSFLSQVRNSPARNLERRAADLSGPEREDFQRYTEARSAVLAALQTALDALQIRLLWEWRLTVRVAAAVLGCLLCLAMVPIAVPLSDQRALKFLQLLVVPVIGGVASAIVAGVYHDVLATIRSMRRDA